MYYVGVKILMTCYVFFFNYHFFHNIAPIFSWVIINFFIATTINEIVALTH